ncbi:hypothetical protein [Streptomyces similanensis]|uniref:XRE family transcriptional regulator n=1 Tax=Streptomyces similanensis TaxID=1274988 RepID=A0ABP9LKH3_9ACTN
MSRKPNEHLIAVMYEAKVSNKGLAKRMRDASDQQGFSLGTTHVSVQRWRNGAGIQPQTAAIMADVLSVRLGRRVTPGDLGFFDPTPPTASDPVGYPNTLPDVLSVLDGLAQERAETAVTDRWAVADADLTAAVLSWMIARPDGIRADRSTQQRVGMRDVRAIRDAAATFMQLDFKYGGGHGHRALRHYFRHEVPPLFSAGYSDRVGHALFSAAAEVSQLLAWTAYDVGNHRLAHRYLTATCA